jgi:hypothetical protein
MTRKKALGCLVVLVAILIFLVKPMLDSFVRQSIYPAPGIQVPSPPPAPVSEITLQTSTGDRVVAWAYSDPALAPGRPAILFFHGNGENLATMHRAGLFEELAQARVAWMAIDYPGYGRSSGTPSEEGVRAAAESAVAWMHEHHPDRPLVLCGWSLGAAAAIGAASRHPEVRGLIALSPWTTLPDAARRLFPAFVVQGLLRETYDSLAAARQIHMPALVAHGEQDNLIPVEHGKAIAEALGAKWVPVPRTGHNDLLARDEVWREMTGFLDEVSAAP